MDPIRDHRDFLERRETAAALNLRRLERRRELAPVTREALDLALYDAFLKLDKDATPALVDELQDLADAGATTSAFPYHELGPPNFADSVRNTFDSYRKPPPPPRKALISGLSILISAGDAFITNRSYVGNGGSPAIWFVTPGNWQPHPHELQLTLAARQLIETMAIHAEPETRFWRDLADSLLYNSLSRLSRFPSPLPTTTIDLTHACLNLISEPPPNVTLPNFWQNLADHLSWRFLASPQIAPITHDLLQRISQRRGLFSTLPPLDDPNLAPTLLTIISAFLHSPPSRRYLLSLLDDFPWLLTLLRQPTILFGLVARRERRLLGTLLRHFGPETKSLRDPHGRTLLLAACANHGRNERLVAMLRSRGFDPRLRDNEGRDAFDLAQGRPRLLDALQP